MPSDKNGSAITDARIYHDESEMRIAVRWANDEEIDRPLADFVADALRAEGTPRTAELAMSPLCATDGCQLCGIEEAEPAPEVTATLAAAPSAIPVSAELAGTDDDACERAAAILRAEADRLEYPRRMVPQESEKIARRQNAFRTAAHYLDPDQKQSAAPSTSLSHERKIRLKVLEDVALADFVADRAVFRKWLQEQIESASQSAIRESKK